MYNVCHINDPSYLISTSHEKHWWTTTIANDRTDSLSMISCTCMHVDKNDDITVMGFVDLPFSMCIPLTVYSALLPTLLLIVYMQKGGLLFLSLCIKIVISQDFNVTCSLSFCLQMSEPITHIDTDYYHDGMRMHNRGIEECLWCDSVHN